MGKFQIKQYNPGDEKLVHALVKTVYDEFISHENSKEGNKLFYDWITTENIAGRQQVQNNLWLAWERKKLAGVIEIRDKQHITLLFVDKLYQGLGIATQLFQKAINESIRRYPETDKFFVHTSLCSVPFYKSLGFKITGKARNKNGIYYIPMEIPISKHVNKHS